MVGDKVVVVSTQILSLPRILTVGLGVTITLIESERHPVDVSVNANFAVPEATPVTTPALVTVAMALLLLAQVPPVDGVKVVVEPIQTAAVPATATVGLGLTVRGDVVA